jgi:hypothetical protein
MTNRDNKLPASGSESGTKHTTEGLSTFGEEDLSKWLSL